MTAQHPEYEVVVPDGDMGREPARVIAKARQVKSAIAGILMVIGIAIPTQLNTDIDTLIQVGVVVAYGVFELIQTFRQGEQTREAVYAPDTAARLARANPQRVEITR